MANQICQTMVEHYGFRLYMIQGNHDAWLFKHLRGEIEPDFVLGRLIRKMAITSNEWCDVVSGDIRFRVEHGANYSSSNPLRVAQKLSARFRMPVVMGHQHHAVTGWDDSGEMQCIASGGVFDPTKLSYYNKSHRASPAMTQGFVIIQHGWATHFSPQDPIVKAL